MSGTNPRISIDLSEVEKQLKEAGARPESFNWYQQIQSEVEALQQHQSKVSLIQSDKLKEPGKEASITFQLLGYWSLKKRDYWVCSDSRQLIQEHSDECCNDCHS